jgi:hypothetical protein
MRDLAMSVDERDDPGELAGIDVLVKHCRDSFEPLGRETRHVRLAHGCAGGCEHDPEPKRYGDQTKTGH